jgi:exosortase
VNAPVETPTAAPASQVALPRFARALGYFNAGLACGLAAALAVFLAPHWKSDPDLSHGWFMPVACVLLLAAARRGPGRVVPGPRVVVAVGLLGIIVWASLGAAGLFAVSLGWSLSIVAFLLALALAAAALACTLALAQHPPGITRWSWAGIAIAPLWVLAAPLPPGTAAELTAQLQLWVTGGVMSVLNLLGVAARQHGNLIELANATIGVEEACSGVRSLVSCVFVALFLSALLVRPWWGRLLLVALAAPLAIGMNFLRSLLLTLLTNGGINISGLWHDVTGFAILAVTAAILVGLALRLGDKPRQAALDRESAGSSRALLASQIVVAVTLTGAAALTSFFAIRTRGPAPFTGPPPDLAALLPATAPGWGVETSVDLARFAATLQTDHLVQRTYYRGSGDDLTQLTVYVAYWAPGQASVSTVALHTPDACWPGVGWSAVPARSGTAGLAVAGRALPPAEARQFLHGDTVQNVWYWHLCGRVPVATRDPRSPRELMRIAWRYGFQREGEQLFVRVSSNRPWDSLQREPLLAEIFNRLRPLGF